MLLSKDFLKYSEIFYRMWFNTNSVPIPQESLFTAEKRDPAVILPFMYNGVETFATIYSDEANNLSGAMANLREGDAQWMRISVLMDKCFEIDFYYVGDVRIKWVEEVSKAGHQNIVAASKWVEYNRKEPSSYDLIYINPDFTSDDLSNMMTVITLSMGTEIETRRGTV